MKRTQIAGSGFGLALLYTSAFYLPNIGGYWLPAVSQQILYPTIIALVVLTPGTSWFVSRYAAGASRDALGLFVMTILCWVAILGAVSAAGYSALGVALLISTSENIEVTRWIRVAMVAAAVIALIAAVDRLRGFWPQLLRFLTILGYAYALLAVVRLEHYPRRAFTAQDHRLADLPRLHAGADAPVVATVAKARQVIWIILDELDYGEALGISGGSTAPPMQNLASLAHVGVSASNAYSPAKDTVASLPALLTGYPLIGLEFSAAEMRLNTRHAGVRPFQESDSVFGRLPGGPESAAILGFYHPYCFLFPSVAPCAASPNANVGRWFDALAFFAQPVIATARWLPYSDRLLPGAVFRAFEPMYRITEDTLRDIPKFLSLEDKSLVFIHVNLPHPPGDYAQRALHLATVGDDRMSYQRNLQLADQVVGTAISMLEARSSHRDILLIVSSDHWHRINSPLVPRRVPWIAWHVGDSVGFPLETLINTVHTGDLVLDFLQGRIENEAQVAAWWQNQTFDPTLMPHGYDY